VIGAPPSHVRLGLRIAAYLLVGVGGAALILAGLLAPLGALLAGGALAGSWWQERLRAQVRTPRLGALLSVVVALAAVVDVVYLAPTVLDGFVHLLLVLVVARMYALRTPRDYRVVAFLTFFMLVAASAAAFGVGFLFVYVGFLLVGTWMLVLQHVIAQSQAAPGRMVAGGSPEFLHGRGLLGLAAGAAAATLLISAGLFFVIPRVGLAALPFRPRLGPMVTGFSDRVELGAYGQIETDASIAMRVHIPEGLGGPADWPDLRWRGIVFDAFDGTAWTLGQPDRVTLHRTPTTDFRLGRYSGRGRLLFQEVFLEPLGTEVMFAAPRVLRVEARSADLVVDDMGGLTMPSAAARLHYRVESELPRPRPARLPDAWGYASARDPGAARFLQLPALAPRIPALAREVAGDAATPYEAALRLEGWLARELRYTLALERRTSLPPLEEFLFERRAGNCEYFAAALAVMLRSLGIPARVVGGFQRGEWNAYGRYFAVRMRDAHAWVEAYFPSAGWVSFDPSPRGAPEAAPDTLALYLDALRMRWYRYVINWSLRDQVEVAVAVRRQAGSVGLGLAGWSELLRRPGPGATAVLVGLAVGVAVVLWWRGPAGPARPAARPPDFYARALRVLARRGLRPEAGETAREFAARVARRAPPAADPFARITAGYEAARFGDRPPTGEERAALDRSLEALRARR
jgi:transglutaminase-like putative cysteine protease